MSEGRTITAVQIVSVPEQAAFYVRDAAKYLGISPNTLRKRADLGLIAARRDGNDNRVFLLGDLDAYLTSLHGDHEGGTALAGRPVETGPSKKGGAL